MPGSHRPSVRGKRYVVSSLHYLATMGGVRILENGGNAADAGVATGIRINVLQPGWPHFGGVAPIIYCPGTVAPVETISGLGRWPRAASIDTFQEYHGGHIPQIGEVFCQKDLANTFRRMIDAERGAQGDRVTGIRAARDLIYKGEIAQEIAEFYAREGGLLTYVDLAAFTVRVEPPHTLPTRAMTSIPAVHGARGQR